MASKPKHVAVLGSTGSIGENTLQVIANSQGTLRAAALSAHTRLERLIEQAIAFEPECVIATSPVEAEKQDWQRLPNGCELLVGQEEAERVVRRSEIDIIVAAIVGAAGLRSTWAAIEAGKTIALANKETLVMAGPLVTELARNTGAIILPIDSEHSAVFQALQAGHSSEVERIILTASGGPFRGQSPENLHTVTVDDALAHPTWDMGPKITIDSATMMNKALEIVEARWLFDLEPRQIEVVVHPQSIVHSLVEFIDGSIIAQMGPPDMKLPIQYALGWPRRTPRCGKKLSFNEALRLEFEPLDTELFPAVLLGIEAATTGGTSGVVLNAANEAAVAGFLEQQIKFTDIVPACRSIIDQHHFEPTPSLDRLLALDRWAREEVSRWICT
ncbi:MAG: 1-deoxy-D-xylulose-5-phosphate reductoisomerase [Planctomycetaceae bacterium]|nr:1-deoxy-D-xylulose-5-phosphate reductoisomerase [Planctomycetaceae bacterium]|tara:strand:- start:8578 stop:9741 length:1164 start_codon:yes stop_codon:yes gene_type:complete